MQKLHTIGFVLNVVLNIVCIIGTYNFMNLSDLILPVCERVLIY